MRIGCCLAYYKDHNNYGTSLQGYSTVKVLQALGHEVRIIKYVKHDSVFRKLKIAPLQMISGGYKAYIRKVKKVCMVKRTGQYSVNIRIRTEANNRFKDENMEELCDKYVGFENLQKGAFNYDAVIVGSDQVWTPLGLYSNFFNLRFTADEIRKVSYASSFGVSSIPIWQRKATGRYLDRIDYLSVREIKAKEIADKLSHKQATIVCDPTLLRTREEWETDLADIQTKASKPYILCYLLGGGIEKRMIIKNFAESKALKIVAIRHTDEYQSCDELLGDECPYNLNPLEFIQLIKNAEYVFTDSFHCTVFSILFNKQFVTFYRFNNKSWSSRNSRIDSLFELFGLQDRLYDGNLMGQADRYIDYNTVGMKVEKLRCNSLEYLKQALKTDE